MSWEDIKLDEIVNIKGGKRLPKGHNFVTEITNHPYLRARDIKDGVIKVEMPVFIEDSTFDIISRYIVKADDVVITIVGANVGDMAIIDWRYDGANLTENAVKLTPKNNSELLPIFLKYSLFGDAQKQKFKQIAAAAAQEKLGIYKIKDFEISLPPLQTQKRIADILSAYDDLIENNLKRIKLLEQAAQNIYKEWFVNMRFPGHENTAVNQETGLPEGWTNGVISNFGKVVTGKTPPTKKSKYYGGDIPFIKTPDMHDSCYVIETTNNLTTLGAETQMNKNLPKNSVMVSCIGTAGVVAMTSKVSQTNQQINSIVFDSSFKSYYFYCFATGLKQLLEGLGSSGATMVNVNKGKFENIQMLIPSEEILKNYSSKVEPMFNQVLTLLSQNQKLKAARDILLPRLMNRTIEV